jgi:hypothetical protein
MLRSFSVIIVVFAIIINIFSSDFDCGFKHSHKNHTGNIIQTADQQAEFNFDQGQENSGPDHDDCINCSCLCNQKIAFYNIPVKFSFNDEETSRFFIETFLNPHFIQLPERPPIIC